MQLVRYLFSYSIVVVVVVLIASGYYYRDTLFPNLFSHVEHMSDSKISAGKPDAGGMVADKAPVDKVTAPAASAPAKSAPKTVAITESVVTPEPVVPAEPAVISEPEVPAEPAATIEPEIPVEPVVTAEPVIPPKPAATPQAPVRSPAQTRATQPGVAHDRMATGQAARSETVPAPLMHHQPQSNSVPRTEQTGPDQMMAGQAEKSSMPMHEQVAPVPAIQPPHQEAGTASLSAADIDRRNAEAIMTARRAYWAGDYDASEQAYQQLIDRYPNEVELYGEAGNVYYAQGKWAQAAQAYAQVVRQLYNSGQIAQADYMLQIVTSLDSDLGNQLQQERNNMTGQP